MALGSTQPLTEMSSRNIPGEVKGGRLVRLTTLPPFVTRLSRENVEVSTSHNPMGLHGLLQGQLDSFIFFIPLVMSSLRIFNSYDALLVKNCHRK
jgi:hypothetical protein